MANQTTNYVTGDAAFAVDRDGVIVLWNQAAENAFGYPATSALGQRCWKLLCGQDTYGNDYCSERCPLRDMAFRHKSVNGFKAAYKTLHQGRKPFEVSCLTVFDDPGHEWLLHICREPDSIDRPAIFSLPDSDKFSLLTPRELEALMLLADGKNNREIASAMGISVPTVRNHIQHLLAKLGVHSRLEAVLLVRQQSSESSSEVTPAEE